MKTKDRLNQVIVDAWRSPGDYAQASDRLTNITDAVWSYVRPNWRHALNLPDNDRLVDVVYKGSVVEARRINGGWRLSLSNLRVSDGDSNGLVAWKEKEPLPEHLPEPPLPPDPFEVWWNSHIPNQHITKSTARQIFDAGVQSTKR